MVYESQAVMHKSYRTGTLAGERDRDIDERDRQEDSCMNHKSYITGTFVGEREREREVGHLLVRERKSCIDHKL